MSDDPGYFRIPAGTMPTTCQGCGQEVYRVMTEHGRTLVSARFDRETRKPSRMQHGVGVDHNLDCEDVKRHQEKTGKASRMVPGAR